MPTANDTIGKLRAEVQTGRDQLEYNWLRTGDQNSWAVGERLKTQSNHRRDLLVWEKHVRDLESKLSAAVDGETQTHKRSTELAVRFAGEDTRSFRMTDAPARVVTSVNGLDTGVEKFAVRISDLMDKLRV